MKHTDGWSNTTSLYIDLATSRTLTIEEAVERLKDESYLRTVWETVRRYSGLDDMDDQALKTTLIDMMHHTLLGNRDSIRRKVGNWVSDDLYSITRDSALEVAFALELPLRDAEDMIIRLCGEGLHRRAPRDIVYIYGLNNGLKLYEVNALLGRLEDEGLVPKKKKEAGEKKGKKAPRADDMAGQALDEAAERRLVEMNLAKAGEEMTALVAGEVELLQSEEELKAFLAENRGRLGELHNTAYTLFIDYMSLLRQPSPEDGPDIGKADGADRDSNMTDKDILQTYMFNKYIPKGKSEASEAVQGALQRAIQSYWPDSSTLSRMRTRTADVTRKVMVLLFLACDGGEGAYGNLAMDSPEDVFQDMYIRLDSMLIDCGFAPLDARSPFDWMVLYCMCSDDSLVIDDKMKRFLQSVFLTPPAEDGDKAE